VIMVVIGGMGSIWGSVFGAAFLTLMPEWVEFFDTYKDSCTAASSCWCSCSCPRA
jgi:ABC-type branched-subunit amino acid transport system permease subunit